MDVSSDFLSHLGPHARFCFTVLALSVFGFASARSDEKPSPIANYAKAQPRPNMQKFVIIFRQGPHDLTEAAKLQRQQQVSAWAQVQNTAGHRLEPRILAPESIRAGTNTADTHLETAREPVTALLFLDAANLAEAAKVAESHPALRFGANVEVRPWAPPAAPTTP